MIKLRFEICPKSEGKNMLTIWGLMGDFSDGQISNTAFEFESYDELQKLLNVAVNTLIAG